MTLNKERLGNLSVDIIAILYVLLFVYAGLIKLIDYTKFTTQIGQSPLLTSMAAFIAIFIPVVELILAILLAIPRLRLLAFYGSFTLMVAFTLYIIIILNFAKHVPCSCGGVLEKFGWTEHLIFNTLFVALSAIAILIQSREKQEIHRVTGLIKLDTMKHSPYLYLSACIIFCLIGMFSIFLISGIGDKIPRQPFARNIIQGFADVTHLTNVNSDSYYIAGLTSTAAYLCQPLDPRIILKIELPALDTQRITLNLENYLHKVNARPVVTIDSPYFYINDGSMPYILKGNIDQWQITHKLADKSYFTASQPISGSSFALRSVSKSRQTNMLGKSTIDTTKYNYDILQKQVDGVFCTDGMLHVDHDLQRILYLYYYRNEYMVMDTNLNLLARANTIDTFKTANVKVGSIGKTSRTMSIPPFPVNKTSCVDGKYLFILSSLMAQNENESDFDNKAICDVYDIGQQKYVFSFYLNDKIQGFKIHKNQLVATYENYFRTYNLNFEKIANLATNVTNTEKMQSNKE